MTNYLNRSLYYSMIGSVILESYAMLALSCIIAIPILNFTSYGLIIQSSICLVFSFFLLTVHKGSFLSLLLIHELVIHAVVQVCVIILLVYSILFSALSAEFDYAPWSNKISYFFWPYKWRVIFFNLLDLISLVDKHRFHRCYEC